MKKTIVAGLIAIFSVSLTGCVNGTSINYEDADKYQVGNASFDGNVSELEIDWISGKVTIEPSVSGEYEIEESSSETLKDRKKVHYYLDGGTLHVKYCASGINMINTMEKDLVIRVPQERAIDEIDITGVSADFNMSGITVGDIDVSTVSGDIKADVNGIDSFDVESVSGEFELSSPVAPLEGDFESVSGDIRLKIPEGSGFTVEHDSVSGDVDSEIGGKISDGKLVCGSGEAKYDIDTVSGDVNINIYEGDIKGDIQI